MKKHEDRSMYFSSNEIHWKPGAKSKDKSKTLLMPYGEMRDYQLRLDAIDPTWEYRVTVVPVADRIVCNAEITLNGVTRSATGDALLVEYDKPSALAGTNAEAQAFKRACSAHNIGRELYFTKPVWVPAADEMDYVWGKKSAALVFEPPYDFLNSRQEIKNIPPAKLTSSRPYSVEEVKAKIEERVAYHIEKLTTASVTDRRVLASILDTVLVDVTKRYELCKWLVGQSSTQKMKQADVNALLDWLGVRQFNATPANEVVKEIHAAHTAALVASGQQELI